MTNSALLKVSRAAKHVGELNELFQKKRPATFIVKTDTYTGKRSAIGKHDEAVMNEAAVICGDIVHNLRSALDHTYWEIVSPHCTSDKERRNTQFPFTSKANEFLKTLHDGYANRAGTGFYCAMRNLRSHGETGGNEMLFLVREMSNLDKHRLLIPTITYTKIAGDVLKAELPDLNITITDYAMFANCTFNWNWDRNAVPESMIGALMPPQSLHIPAQT